MALSPLDIKNKTFSTKLRGYSPEEVDDFLDQVINDYEDVVRKRKELEKSLKHAEEKLTYFNELKDALNQSIIVAQDTADKLKDSASRESDVLVTSAQAEAKAILSEAKSQADTLISEANHTAGEIMRSSQTQASQLAVETDDLKKKTREFHRNLSLILESQLEIVKGSDWVDLLRPFSTYMDERHSTVRELLESQNNSVLHTGTPVVDTPADSEIELDQAVEANETDNQGHTQAIELDNITFEIARDSKDKDKNHYSRVKRSLD